MLNLFAFRSTDPRALRSAVDPVGANDVWLLSETFRRRVLCAWGVHGKLLGRGAAVRRMLADNGRDLVCLGLTAAGEPKHPLYAPYADCPQPLPLERAKT